MIKQLVLSAISLLAFTANAQDVYVVAGATYSDVSGGSLGDDESVGYRIGIGYQINHQWSAEFDYGKVADAETTSGNYDLNSGRLSLLGRASGRSGELFYRLGAVVIDNSIDLHSDESSRSDTLYGATVGLGFDYYVGLKNALRFEVNYTKAQESIEYTSGYIGYQYRF